MGDVRFGCYKATKRTNFGKISHFEFIKLQISMSLARGRHTYCCIDLFSSTAPRVFNKLTYLLRCADVLVTRRLGEKRLGDKLVRLGQQNINIYETRHLGERRLDEISGTFGRIMLDVWATTERSLGEQTWYSHRSVMSTRHKTKPPKQRKKKKAMPRRL